MAKPERSSVLSACRTWLRPVARWLLRSGITWKEFAELSRSVFVATATEEFGIRGRPTNVSRVALLTGLSRRDVRKARLADGTGDAAEAAEEALNHASRVMTGWHLDADFIGADGRPLDLPMDGDGACLEALLRRYAGDIPATALVKELIRSQTIERTNDGRYRALRRYYMPSPMDARAVERSGSVLADLVATVEHNLARGERESARFEGRAQNRRIDPRHLPAWRAFMEREAQGFLERVDEWLSTHEATDDVAGIRLGAGVYAIQDSKTGVRA
ncbi:MAG: DUF6502 family protein [Steroidobacteraceae bacterium]